MLPFLKHAKDSGAAMPAESIKREPDEEAPFDALEAAGEDLITAVHAKDAKGAAAALRAAFDLAASEPNPEGV